MSAQIESYEEISREGLVDMLEEATGYIAALEADKKRLVEALRGLCWVVDNGDFDDLSIGSMRANEARDLLSEVS